MEHVSSISFIPRFIKLNLHRLNDVIKLQSINGSLIKDIYTCSMKTRTMKRREGMLALYSLLNVCG